jgi:AcrR family transcriptional regulator
MSNMTRAMKRKYNSLNRRKRSEQTSAIVADAAKELFKSRGFESVIIEEIAGQAQTPTPTVCALFISKKGLLKEVTERALIGQSMKRLFSRPREIAHPVEHIRGVAGITRKVYDSERADMNLLNWSEK